MEPRTATPEWSLARRTLYRFAFAYLFLYFFPRPLTYIPYVQKVVAHYQKLWDLIVVWAGKQWFGLEISTAVTGSGDKPYDWVRLLCILILAVTVTAVWMTFFRKRSNDARLQEWLRVYLRFTVSLVMISYGMAKVIPAQFTTEVSFNRLLQPIGETSPMGLLWTFMGATLTYNVFTGAAETLGGLLLVARRTTLLGALVCIGVMANVVMLNFTYDVPVKLLSSHLLLSSILIAAPDLRRLADVFVFNRRSRPAAHRPLIARPALARAARVLWTVCILGFFGLSLYSGLKQAKDPMYGNFGPKPPFYGLWYVEEIAIDGEIRPPLLTDEQRWRHVIFQYADDVTIYFMDTTKKRKGFEIKLDTSRKTWKLTDYQDPKLKYTFSYQQPAPGLLAIEGRFEGRQVRARLRLADLSEFPILSRGFHWISERPYSL
jgi:uncharacterized membrane protein YphA (DoxX/SURF4 family)